jgi:SAM-dependent methyltransferase
VPSPSQSNSSARAHWNESPVGSQRSSAPIASAEFFEDVRRYRYGYETPWIPDVFRFDELRNRNVLEIGVGLGIDAVEMMKSGVRCYTGLDITPRHLELARTNLAQHYGHLPDFGERTRLIEGDLLDVTLPDKFDRIYSFGVLHHIAHERAYLERLRGLIAPGGALSFAVYSKFSAFNVYLVGTWLARDRLRNSLEAWRSHLAEGTDLGSPVVVKIRDRRSVQRALHAAGLRVTSYTKAGFVQNYLPVVGRRFAPNGITLRTFGRVFGWYHCFFCKPA